MQETIIVQRKQETDPFTVWEFRGRVRYVVTVEATLTYRLHLGYSPGEPVAIVDPGDATSIMLAHPVGALCFEWMTSGGIADDSGSIVPEPNAGSAVLVVSDQPIRVTRDQRRQQPASIDSLPDVSVDPSGMYGLDVVSGIWIPITRYLGRAANIIGSRREGGVAISQLERTSGRAIFRNTARPYPLSRAFAGGSSWQYATLWHDDSVEVEVRIRSLLVGIVGSTAAVGVAALVRYLTGATQPTAGVGTTADVSAMHGDDTITTECQALPTAQGVTDGAIRGFAYWNLGITGAVPVTNPPPPIQFIELIPPSEQPLIIRALTAEGYAVSIDVTAAATVTAFVVATFSESSPFI